MSLAGFQSISNSISFDAPIRFKPTPPAFELKRNTTKNNKEQSYISGSIENSVSLYPGCQRLFISSFRFRSSVYSCGLGLQPKICRLAADRAREKPQPFKVKDMEEVYTEPTPDGELDTEQH